MKIGPLGDEHSWEPSRPAATKIIDTPCSIAAAAIDSTWAKKKKKKKKHMGQNHQSIVSYYIVTRTSNRKGKAPDDPISCGRFHDGPQTFPSIRTTNNYLYIFCFLCKNMRHTTMPDTPRGAIRINNNHTLYGLRVCLWGIVSSLAHFHVRKWKWRFFFTQNSQYPKGVKLFSWLFYSFQNCVFFLLLVVDVPDEKKTVQKYLKKKEKKYRKSSTRRHSIVQPNFELPSVFVFFFSTHTIRPVKHPTQLYWSTRPTPTTSTISYVKSRHVPTSRRLLFRYIEKKKWFSMFFFSLQTLSPSSGKHWIIYGLLSLDGNMTVHFCHLLVAKKDQIKK